MKKSVFNVVLSTIDADLRNGVGYPLSEMKDACNNLIGTTEHKTFTNKELKVLLLWGFDILYCSTKSYEISNIDKNDIPETVQNYIPIKETALKTREILLKENDPLEDEFCDANDLSDAWYNMKILEVILEFLCVLLNVDHKGFYNMKILEVTLEFLCVLLNVDHKGFYNMKILEVILEFLCVLLNVDHKCFYNDVKSNPKISITKRRKIIALCQIMFYDVNNGKKKTPLHVVHGEMIHDACRIKHWSLIVIIMVLV